MVNNPSSSNQSSIHQTGEDNLDTVSSFLPPADKVNLGTSCKKISELVAKQLAREGKEPLEILEMMNEFRKKNSSKSRKFTVIPNKDFQEIKGHLNTENLATVLKGINKIHHLTMTTIPRQAKGD